MAKSHILLTSGFIVPANRWFTPIERDDSYRYRLLGDDPGLESDHVLSGLVSANALHSSSACNEAFLSYQHKPNFESFMAMVDLFCEVFKEVDLAKFYEIQVNNPYLSPLGFSFITEVIFGGILDTWKTYAMAPSFFRVTKETNYSELQKRKHRKLDTNGCVIDRNTSGRLNDLIAKLSGHEALFASVFKYLLTDSNRGNSYA